MNRKLLTGCAALLVWHAVAAQDSLKVWTLQTCLDYALENNIQLQQSRNDYLSGLEDTRRSEGRTAAVARSLGDTGLHELPFVERRKQQQLHRHLRNQRRADALRRRQTAHGGQGTEAPKPHRRTLGRRSRERHPHRHRRSLHAGALRRRSRGGSRRYGRSLARPARPRRADVAGGIDQQGRFRPARKPVCERPLPSSRRPVVARRLQVAAQTAARTRHHGGDESCRARRGRRDRLAGPARQNRHLRDGARRHAADRTGAAGRRDGRSWG